MSDISILETIILGIVEGVTEFLPISSTAHLDISRHILSIQNNDFVKSFEIVIQLGAILAVIFFYRKRIFESFNKSFLYFRNIFIAFLPTGIIGFILYKVIKTFLFGNTLLASIVLVLGGIVIILFERYKNKEDENISSKTIENLSIRELLILGGVQALAVVPGVSRSGAVIIGGRVMNLPKILIVEFSFLLAIPTMFSAVLYDLYKTGFSFSLDNWIIIGIGFLVSFFIALLVIKWLLSYIQKKSFEIFGWYRIIFGLIVLIFFL